MRQHRSALVMAVIALAAIAWSSPLSLASLFAEQRTHVHKSTFVGSAAVPEERLADVACEDGEAGPFTCDGMDLLSFTPLDEFRGIDDQAVLGGGTSDVWGWTDPEGGDEYVMLGKTNGTAFFNVTDPTDPVYLGDLPNIALAQLIWHDIKVYENHAFIVSESNPHGMRVFDLTRLRGVTEPQTWTDDAVYPLTVAAHNLAINEESGFAYIVGGNAALAVPDICNSGLHMVDISEPTLPLFAGCHDTGEGGGLSGVSSYVHDTQCVIYDGPDLEHTGKELCFNSSEDHMSIVDVSDKAAPVQISLLEYPGVAYAHQGWLTEDHANFLMGDELDEPAIGNTRTLIFDVSDIDAPQLTGQHAGATRSIDHNLYTLDGLVYQSNYTSGVRVLDLIDVADGELTEVAWFDTFPDHDQPVFEGTWSNYPYFESGTIAASGIGEGLFLLQVQDEVLEDFAVPGGSGP